MWLNKIKKTLTKTSTEYDDVNIKDIKQKKTSKKTIGDWAENTSRDFLIKQGQVFQTSNYNCPLGEIDLVMLDNDQLVFVEVRYRKNTSYGSALESVSHSKQKKIIKTAQHYLQKNKLTHKISCRFDVIGIQKDSIQEPKIEWIKNAFY